MTLRSPFRSAVRSRRPPAGKDPGVQGAGRAGDLRRPASSTTLGSKKPVFQPQPRRFLLACRRDRGSRDLSGRRTEVRSAAGTGQPTCWADAGAGNGLGRPVFLDLAPTLAQGALAAAEGLPQPQKRLFRFGIVPRSKPARPGSSGVECACRSGAPVLLQWGVLVHNSGLPSAWKWGFLLLCAHGGDVERRSAYDDVDLRELPGELGVIRQDEKVAKPR